MQQLLLYWCGSTQSLLLEEKVAATPPDEV